jgi:hypothetical protein
MYAMTFKQDITTKNKMYLLTFCFRADIKADIRVDIRVDIKADIKVDIRVVIRVVIKVVVCHHGILEELVLQNHS